MYAVTVSAAVLQIPVVEAVVLPVAVIMMSKTVPSAGVIPSTGSAEPMGHADVIHLVVIHGHFLMWPRYLLPVMLYPVREHSVRLICLTGIITGTLSPLQVEITEYQD